MMNDILLEMQNEVLEKSKAEFKEFIKELKTKTVDEVIRKAYEITIKEELLIFLENVDGLDEEKLTALNQLNYPLSSLYQEWLSQDTSINDEFLLTVEALTRSWKISTKESYQYKYPEDEEMEM